jgi:hypothetical protein
MVSYLLMSLKSLQILYEHSVNSHILCIIQWNPVKKILKIPKKSYFLSRKFLKRVILMKWENFGAFLSWLLRGQSFLTGFFLSEFHCLFIMSVWYYVQIIVWYSYRDSQVHPEFVLFCVVLCFRSWKRPFWLMEQKILEVPFFRNWLLDFCVAALEIMTFQLLITRCFCAVCLGKSVRWPWIYI